MFVWGMPATITSVSTYSYRTFDAFMAAPGEPTLYGCEHTALQALGPDFVFGYVQAIDGEKDPRNLLTALRLSKLVIQGLDISRFAEVGVVCIACVRGLALI
mgnify:CR=1 FL=1